MGAIPLFEPGVDQRFSLPLGWMAPFHNEDVARLFWPGAFCESLVGEKELLGEAGGGAEMGATEMGDLGGSPAGESVARLERFDDPDVDGEGFETARAEQQDTVRHFFADAGKQAKTRFGVRVGQAFGFFQPAGIFGEELRGFVDEPGAEAELAGA